MNRLVTYLLLAAGLIACRTPQSTGAGPAPDSGYDFESLALHPTLQIFHHADDSSQLLVFLPASDLLYTRRDDRSPFEAKVELRIDARNAATGAALDSSVIILSDRKSENTPGVLSVVHRMKMEPGIWKVEVIMTDLNRGSSFSHILLADKQSTFSAQNYILKDPATNQPVAGTWVAPGRDLTLYSPRNEGKEHEAWHYKIERDVKLPPPPFSANEPDIPQLDEASRSLCRRDSLGRMRVIVTKGVHFFTHDPQAHQGFVVTAVEEGFPDVRMYAQLTGPLRFITSKSEYDEINSSSFPKPLIDNFWIECGGSKDRARELIRIYYSRVEEANRSFSSYTEGWRTDRGMIHLIFGNPNRIYRNDQSETWIYGEEGSPGSVSFLFRKRSSPLSDNIYVLQRDPMMKSSWEQMVTVWRQGRVYNE